MKKKIIFLSIIVLMFGIFIHFNSTSVKADDPVDLSYNTNCDITLYDLMLNHENTARNININVSNIAPGKRITDIVYCLKSDDCTNDANWHSFKSFDNSNPEVSALGNGVGSNVDLSYWFLGPVEDIYVKAIFEDFEPMNIEYALYEGNEYTSSTLNLNNYASYNPLITGYMGGDIILPADCLNNGCALKFTLTDADYNAYINRITYYNEHISQDHDNKKFLALSEMFNHLYTVGSDSIKPLYQDYSVPMGQEELVLEHDDINNTTSFYIFVNKYFSENNRADFAVGDNNNRILAEEYIGLNYKVDRKYFDEGSNYGFLSFNEFNNYEREAILFYGVPKIKFSVDEIKPVVLTPTGEAHMGTIKYPYDTIESADNTNYPINNNYELTITSFYNPEYVVPIVLKNGNTKVIDATLTLSRFAFGEIIVVDSEGNNCNDGRVNQNCSVNNAYASAEYRGLYDTFYSNGTPVHIDNALEISRQSNGIEVVERDNITAIARNLDFNPWAVAIFYSGDKVVGTKSFDLGEIVKIEGYSDIPIEEGVASQYIANYNPDNYDAYGYGLGYEIPIKNVKYFKEENYNRSNLNATLILASKQEIEENNVTRIALFLTNGDIKDDEANFPELKYGVGEGKIYEIDHRTFDRVGGND